MRNGRTQIGIHHAGLHTRDLILGVDGENPVHARERRDDAAVPRDRAARKAGTGAASNERCLMLLRKTDDPNHIRGGAGENNAVGPSGFDRAVVFIEQQFVWPVQDRAGAEQFLQIVHEP